MYQEYYVLSDNKVLGHFGSLRECFTIEEAVEMAGIDTTQEALERLYMEGCSCVYHDDETDDYVFDANWCRVINFLPTDKVLELCERIRYSREWDPVDTCILCDIAGLNEEWNNATAENFEDLVYEAADILGGVIV